MRCIRIPFKVAITGAFNNYAELEDYERHPEEYQPEVEHYDDEEDEE